MLKMATYTKDDLVKEFNTDKMCNITRSLTTMGYEFETNGKRGKNYRLTITKAPNMFKVFCTSELGIPAQSDFRLLRNFFYYFFCDEEFQQLPIEEMVRIMESEGKKVSRQTISKWIQFLKNKDIITEGQEYLYFTTVKTDISTESLRITREEYLAAWKAYWDVINNGGMYHEALNAMYKVNGGATFKKPIIEENGFYSDLIDSLVELLDEEE